MEGLNKFLLKKIYVIDFSFGELNQTLDRLADLTGGLREICIMCDKLSMSAIINIIKVNSTLEAVEMMYGNHLSNQEVSKIISFLARLPYLKMLNIHDTYRARPHGRLMIPYDLLLKLREKGVFLIYNYRDSYRWEKMPNAYF